MLGGVGRRPRLHHIGGLERQAAGAEFDFPEAELAVEAVHGEGFGEAHPHALVGLQVERCAALGQQVWNIYRAGIRQPALGFHREGLDGAEDGLAKALAHQAAHQHPVAQLHVDVAACEGVGHIEAFGGERGVVPVADFFLQEEAS